VKDQTLTIIGVTIQSLFGDECRGDTFTHDEEMKVLSADMEKERKSQFSQQSQLTNEVEDSARLSSPILPLSPQLPPATLPREINPGISTEISAPLESGGAVDSYSSVIDLTSEPDSQESIRQKLGPNDSHARTDAFLQMRAHARGESYEPIDLVSTTDKRGDVELRD
jgi:hypothetical protein